MGLFDKAKDAFEAGKDKIDPSKISEGIEKAGDFIDSKTGGKYADKIDKVQDFAHDKADDLLSKDDPAQPDAAGDPLGDPAPVTPPAQQQPPTAP